jgi:hypothetical protein
MSGQWSILVPDESGHCQLNAQIDGIDRAFLFGNAQLPWLAPGISPNFALNRGS